jgi:hypothetical protein
MPTTLGWTDSANLAHPVGWCSDEVIELPLLLPEWQVAALEDAAQKRGMTVGQLLRRLFADLFPRPVAAG